MVAVQTYWGSAYKRENNNFAWANQRNHYLSIAYSVLQLKKFFRKCILVTDREGQDTLIRKLSLPYDHVIVELDQLNTDLELWSLAKIYTYSKINRPFIHFDLDVFLWANPLELNSLISPNILVQSKEFHADYFKVASKHFLERRDTLLPEQFEFLNECGYLHNYNMAVFGGHDLSFIKEYTKYVNENYVRMSQDLVKFNKDFLNVFLEQFLLYFKVYREKAAINFLFEDTTTFHSKYPSRNYVQMRESDRYLHAHHLKSCPVLNAFLEEWMRSEHQTYFDIICSLY